MTIKLLKVHEEHKFLSIDFPNYLPIYPKLCKKKKNPKFLTSTPSSLELQVGPFHISICIKNLFTTG